MKTCNGDPWDPRTFLPPAPGRLPQGYESTDPETISFTCNNPFCPHPTATNLRYPIRWTELSTETFPAPYTPIIRTHWVCYDCYCQHMMEHVL